MKISVGDSIGRYHILEALGEGGMAAVYKAYDTRLEREVAIKFLRTELFGEAVLEQLFKRFEREAKALARLSHFHIVKIHDYGEYEGTPYLVMEYVSGGTLKKRMGKPMDWREALELILPVARALEYAHQHSVLHRDIKPANILITEGGEPLLSDFGIAKILESSESQAITGTGVGIGTPEYMAPEQGLAKEVDARTDVYALGVVLYEMVTGRKPYVADTPTAVLIKQIHDPLPNPTSFAPELPANVEHLLVKALAKQQENRFASMDEFARAMEQLLKGQPSEQKAAETVVAGWQPNLEEPAATLIAEKAGEKPPVEAPATVVAQAAPHVEKPAPARPKKAWSRWWLAAPIVVVAAAAVGLAIWLIPPASPPAPAPTFTFVPPSPVPTKIPQPTPLPVIEKPPADKQLKIGVVLPLSGPQAAFGAMAEKGVMLAVDQWNGRGGVLGLTVLPVMVDGRCSNDPTLNAAIPLIEEQGIKFIIGEICSRPSIALAEYTNPARVIQISPASTNPQLTVDDNGATRPFTFRVCLVDPLQGLVAARFAYDNLAARKVYAVYEMDNPYSQDLAEAFMRQFENFGNATVGGVGYPAGEKNYSVILKKIALVKPDLIYLPATYDVVNQFIRQAREQGIQTPFLGSDGWDSPALDVPIAAGSFFTTHFWMDDPRPEVIAFRDAFRERFKDEQGNPLAPDVFSALTFDATNIMLQAISDAGSVDTTLVQAALERIEFPGVTGPIHFDENHNPIKPIVVVSVTPDGLRFVGLFER